MTDEKITIEQLRQLKLAGDPFNVKSDLELQFIFIVRGVRESNGSGKSVPSLPSRSSIGSDRDAERRDHSKRPLIVPSHCRILAAMVNLERTDCRFCSGEVLLDEEPRLLKAIEYLLLPEHLRHALVANATCVECCAEYVAWFETDWTNTLGGPPRSATNMFRDLSHRSTMSSEPGEPDLPVHVIDFIRIRRTWPTCLECGKRIFEGYGCQCPEPQLFRVVVRPLLVIPEWRSSGSAITTYDLFVPPPVLDEGDEHEWTALRTLIENSYLVGLEEEVRIIQKDLADHYIEVPLLPTGDRAYRGDDRDYHRLVEEIVNRATLVVEAETLQFELSPETPIDGGAGPGVDPKRGYILQPHQKQYHWLAAFCWAYSKLPHHWIHIMQEQVNAYREGRKTGQPDRWWVSLEDDKLTRPVAYFERDLPLGMQVGDLYIADGASFVAEDKRVPRLITARVIEIDEEEPTPSDPTCDRNVVEWPAATMIGQYPNP